MKLSWYTNYYLTNLYQLLMEKCSMWYTNYRGHNNWYVRPPTDEHDRYVMLDIFHHDDGHPDCK